MRIYLSYQSKKSKRRLKNSQVENDSSKNRYIDQSKETARFNSQLKFYPLNDDTAAHYETKTGRPFHLGYCGCLQTLQSTANATKVSFKTAQLTVCFPRKIATFSCSFIHAGGLPGLPICSIAIWSCLCLCGKNGHVCVCVIQCGTREQKQNSVERFGLRI